MNIDCRTVNLLILLLGLLSGCRESVTGGYGQRRGTDAGRSVNGTGVLAHMFEQAGHQVSSWRRLSPKLDREQVIVWFPNDFAAPTDEQINYFESWLNAEPGRTLIYVGRDYDALLDYWQQMLNRVEAEQRIEIRRVLAEARSRHMVRRQEPVSSLSCRWFTFDPQQTSPSLDSLEGPWARELDPSGFNFHLTTLVHPKASDERGYVASTASDVEEVTVNAEGVPVEVASSMEWEEASSSAANAAGFPVETAGSLHFETLLAADGHLLVGRYWRPNIWSGSQVFVVANGAWLLNLPLIETDHRKLAGELIEACGVPGRVCFLESGPGALRISDNDSVLPLELKAFTVWPLSAILMHLTLLGILFCFCAFPILGRVRQLPPDGVSDFGKHVAAVGDLLERRGDANYARQKLEQYQELTQGKSSKREDRVSGRQAI